MDDQLFIEVSDADSLREVCALEVIAELSARGQPLREFGTRLPFVTGFPVVPMRERQEATSIVGILQELRGVEAFTIAVLAVIQVRHRAMNSYSLPSFTRQFPEA